MEFEKVDSENQKWPILRQQYVLVLLQASHEGSNAAKKELATVYNHRSANLVQCSEKTMVLT